jgi:dihydroneopterin aldolase
MPVDRILISRIDCLASLGVTAEERARKQHLSIDLEFLIDASKPAATDSIKETIDYAKVAAVVAEVCASQPFHLIETIAERIAARVLSEFPTTGTRVLLRKISPIANPRVEHVSIEIVRP